MATLSERVALLATCIANYIRDSIKPRLIPSGGASGQVLGKTSTTDYSVNWVSVSASASAGGSSGQIQYNSSGLIAGAANVGIDNADLMIAANTSPVRPTSGAKVFGKSTASRMMVGAFGPKGESYLFQPSIIDKNIAMWIPPGSSTIVPGVFGMTAPTALGTATARAVSATNYAYRARRLGYNSSTTAGSFAGHYSTSAQYTVGDSYSKNSGFYYSCTFQSSDGFSGTRMFVGLSSSVATPTNVEPNTLTNCIGIAQLSTDNTQLYLVYGGSAAQSAIALGARFPLFDSSYGPTYQLHLFSSPSEAGVVYYRVERKESGEFVEGALTPATVGVQTPDTSKLLAHRAWKCNNTLSSAVQMDIGKIYIETN